MGTSHRPIAVTDMLCFGPADLPVELLPEGVLHPRLIADGVIAGVADYGNKIGLATVAGAVLYDPAYMANPLVYCGCIGVAPERTAGARRPARRPRRRARRAHRARRAARRDVLQRHHGRHHRRRRRRQRADRRPDHRAAADQRPRRPVGPVHRHHRLRRRRPVVGSRRDGRARRRRRRRPPRPAEVPRARRLGDLAERGPGADGPRRAAGARRRRRRPLRAPRRRGHGARHVHRRRRAARARRGHDWSPSWTPRSSTTAGRRGRCRPTLPHPLRPAGSAAARRRSRWPTLLALLAHPNIASKAEVVRRYDHEIRGATVVRPLLGVDGRGHADGVVLAAAAGHPRHRHRHRRQPVVRAARSGADGPRGGRRGDPQRRRRRRRPGPGGAAGQLLVGRSPPSGDARRAGRRGARLLRRIRRPRRPVRQRQGLAEQRVPRQRRATPRRSPRRW